VLRSMQCRLPKCHTSKCLLQNRHCRLFNPLLTAPRRG
jgi:hypothetical protein